MDWRPTLTRPLVNRFAIGHVAVSVQLGRSFYDFRIRRQIGPTTCRQPTGQSGSCPRRWPRHCEGDLGDDQIRAVQSRRNQNHLRHLPTNRARPSPTLHWHHMRGKNAGSSTARHSSRISNSTGARRSSNRVVSSATTTTYLTTLFTLQSRSESDGPIGPHPRYKFLASTPALVA